MWISTEIRRRRPKLRLNEACKRDMTHAGLKEDDTTGQHGVIRSSAIPASPDDADGTGQGPSR